MSDEICHEIEIDASIELVFDLLVTEEGLLEWIAIDAVVDARPGGLIQWTHRNGRTVRGEIVEIDRPNRLAFTYGWVDDPHVGPGSTVVEMILSQDNDLGPTSLRLIHRGLPNEQEEPHLEGWKHFLHQFVEAAERTEPPGA